MMATYPSVVCFSQQSCKTSVQTNFYSIVIPMTSYAKLISLQPSAAKETSYVEMGSERRCVACAAGVSGANQRQGWSLQRIASGSTLVQQPGSRTPTTVLIVIICDLSVLGWSLCEFYVEAKSLCHSRFYEPTLLEHKWKEFLKLFPASPHAHCQWPVSSQGVGGPVEHLDWAKTFLSIRTKVQHKIQKGDERCNYNNIN